MDFLANKIFQFACMPNVFDAEMDEWSLMMELPPFGEDLPGISDSMIMR